MKQTFYGRIKPDGESLSARGAWIETSTIWKPLKRSLPAWGRGLKLECVSEALRRLFVAPFAGAWIEISTSWAGCRPSLSRASRRAYGLK